MKSSYETIANKSTEKTQKQAGALGGQKSKKGTKITILHN